jgi:hypothetical protein
MNLSKSSLTSTGKKEALRWVRLKLIGLQPNNLCARTCYLQELSSGQTKTSMATGNRLEVGALVIFRVSFRQNRSERERGFAVRGKSSLMERIAAIPKQAEAGLSVADLTR